MTRRKITIEVEVPEGAEVESLSEAEDLAFGAAREVFGQLLQHLADERQEPVGECPRCGAQGGVRKGVRSRRLYTRMGEVRLRGQRARCRECGHVFSPPAAGLGAAAGGADDAAG